MEHFLGIPTAEFRDLISPQSTFFQPHTFSGRPLRERLHRYSHLFLSDANLSHRDLSYANLSNAKLSEHSHLDPQLRTVGASDANPSASTGKQGYTNCTSRNGLSYCAYSGRTCKGCLEIDVICHRDLLTAYKPAWPMA